MTSLQQSSDQRKNLASHVRELSSRVHFKSEQEIDQRIHELETEISTSSLSVKQEKEMIANIRNLRSSKDVLRKLVQDRAALDQDKDTQEELHKKLKAKSRALDELKQQEVDLVKQFEDLKAASKASRPNIKALLEEKSKLSGEIKEISTEIRQKRSEMREKNREWEDYVYDLRRWKQQLQKERWAAQKAEREKRDAEEDGMGMGGLEDSLPAAEELLLCDDLHKYLRGLEGRKEEAAAPTSKVQTEMTVIGRFGDQEENPFAGAGKKRKGKKAGSQDAKAGTAKISHSLDALAGFARIGVATPVTAAGIPDALAAVRAKKEAFAEMSPEEIESIRGAQKAEAKASKKGSQKQESASQNDAAVKVSVVPVDAETVRCSFDFKQAVVGN